MADAIPVSLAITTLNEASNIGRFLDSVERQTALPYEIVICDGGSKDGTVAEISKRLQGPFGVVLIRKPGSNIAAGRNAAIEAAACDVVAVSDAGCVLDDDWLRRITAPLLGDGGISAVGGGYRYCAETPFERMAAAAEMDVADIPPEVFLPSSRSMAFKKQAWKDAGGYPERLTFAGEDTEFCLALKRNGHDIFLDRGARVDWRPRGALRAYIKQHFLYGVGDGEARNKGSFYQKISLKFAAASGLAAAGIAHDPLWFAAAAALAAVYAARLYRLYRWSHRNQVTAVAAFFLILIKEAALLCGYLRGRCRRAESSSGA